ncbi:MAG TPA: hypothetical protein VFN11_08120, partial [Ktedonobacterales bacterium]|nr:hypothetical protein [Ktedonobacterales bacterium]
ISSSRRGCRASVRRVSTRELPLYLASATGGQVGRLLVLNVLMFKHPFARRVMSIPSCVLLRERVSLLLAPLVPVNGWSREASVSCVPCSADRSTLPATPRIRDFASAGIPNAAICGGGDYTRE